jgi:hypothetical protein
MSSNYVAKIIVAAFCAVALAACQKNVTLRVDSEVPEPLVTKLPLSVGVYYPDKFRRFAYTENSEARGTWHITSGDSQVNAFSRIIGDMFTEFRELNASQQGDVELVLVPEISRMQFATPEETGFDYFEAWVEYVISLKTGEGEPLPEGRYTGDGQATAERFAGIETGLAASLSNALRNAGAQLAMGLPEHPPVQQRIQRFGL